MSILKGVTDSREVILYDHEGREVAVDIKPLSYDESLQIKQATPDKDTDIPDAIFLNMKTSVLCVALGTVSDEWDIEVIESLWPAEWIEQVANEILKLTGEDAANDEEEVFYFLVYHMHISPRDIPYLTWQQVQGLINQHNKSIKKENKKHG